MSVFLAIAAVIAILLFQAGLNVGAFLLRLFLWGLAVGLILGGLAALLLGRGKPNDPEGA